MKTDCRIGDVFNAYGDILVCREFCACFSSMFAYGMAGDRRAERFAGAWFRYLIDGTPTPGFDPPTLRLFQFGPETADGLPVFDRRKAAFVVPGAFLSVWRTLGGCPGSESAAMTDQDRAAWRLTAFCWLGYESRIGPDWWGAVRESCNALRRNLAADALVFNPSAMIYFAADGDACQDDARVIG